jgi:hypothetical protein
MTPLVALSILALLPVALADIWNTPRPLLGFSSPKAFLGLDDGFSQALGTVIFIPSFHACGTLLVVNAAGLEYSDFDQLPAGNHTLRGVFDSAPTNVEEDNAKEGTVLAWTRGWRKSCGRGDANKEVRVVDVQLAAQDDRAAWAKALGTPAHAIPCPTTRSRCFADGEVAPHLAALPPAPHNSVVLLTSVSAATLSSLREIAASQPPSSPQRPSRPKPKPTPTDVPARRPRTHRKLAWLVIGVLALAFWGAVLAGAFVLGRWALRRYQARRLEREEGALRLPLTGGEDEHEV